MKSFTNSSAMEKLNLVLDLIALYLNHPIQFGSSNLLATVIPSSNFLPVLKYEPVFAG